MPTIKQAVAGLALAGAIVAAGPVTTQVQIDTLPQPLKLAVSSDKILSANPQTDVQFTYDADGNVIATTTLDDVSYLYPNASLQPAPNEIVSRRTSTSRTFQEGNKIVIYFDAVEPYYQDSDGQWWSTTEATTTQDAFDLQTESIFSIPFASAQTTSFLTTNAGNGNQTFNVPSDWNNSANQVACIGSGGQGSVNTNGAGSGGGGAYASTTNITLTPGGTAIYNIGASASSTSPANNAVATYFNGTAFNSASVSCDWGRAANGVSSGAGGSVANSIGTTKFAGGAGGGSFNSAGLSATGGGGSAGEFGAGQKGGNDSSTSGNGGGGGGGSDGRSSTVGIAPTTSNGGNGGAGAAGTGGGIAPGGNGTANKGAGGAGGANSGFGPGGNGSCDQSFDATHGACGGGGGDGAGFSGSGGAGGTYGGGGGGVAFGAGGLGGQGLIIIIYTPATPAGAKFSPRQFEDY